jgi:hypothetical protein
VQVETLEGLSNIESIAKTDGVDAVFIGPADLRANMGLVGQMTHPAVAQTCLGLSGRFRPMRRPLFHTLRFCVTVGSSILGMFCPPFLPPSPYLNTALTTQYGMSENGCFLRVMLPPMISHLRHFLRCARTRRINSMS